MAVLALGFALIGLAWRAKRPFWSLGGVGFIIAAAVLLTFTSILSPRSTATGDATVDAGAGRSFLASLRRSQTS